MHLLEFLNVISKRDGILEFQAPGMGARGASGGFKNDMTGWIHSGTGKNLYSYGWTYHYKLIKQHWKEMGLDANTAKSAEDEYAGDAQRAAYANGWIRWFYNSEPDKLHVSGPPETLRKAAPSTLKLVKEIYPRQVVVDVIDPVSDVARRAKSFDVGNTRELRSFLQGYQTESILESMLLFELRNILNVDGLKQWADNTAHDIAAPFRSDDSGIYQILVNWGKKALLKNAIAEFPGEKVSEPNEYKGKLWVTLGSSGKLVDVGELPPWAQEAIKRGEELTYVSPILHRKIGQPRDIQKEVTSVRDWMRYKYQQNPREFTPNRLARIPWTEAVRLSDEYHAALAAEQAKIATMNDVEKWWRTGGKEIVGSSFHWDGLTDGMKLKAIRAFEKDTGKKVKPPEDDPTGHEPFVQYTKDGEMIEPAEKIPPSSKRMDLVWDEHPEYRELYPEKVEKRDFVPAPEIGEQWVKLKTDKCVKYEGTLMGHCVGGYGREVEAGDVWIYSFRDKGNQPHVTIEVTPDRNGAIIEQIKGKENEPPVQKYHGKVIDFLKKLGMKYELSYGDEAEGDLSGMGMFLEGYGTAISIRMIDPPFDMDKFVRYEEYQAPPEDDESGDYPDSEIRDEDEGNLYEILRGHGENANTVLADIMNTGSCWYDNEDQDYQTGGFTRTVVCYNGEDKYSANRKWITVVE